MVDRRSEERVARIAQFVKKWYEPAHHGLPLSANSLITYVVRWRDNL